MDEDKQCASDPYLPIAISFRLDEILPDDLVQRILTYLPIASIIRVGSVCKRWNEIVKTRKFSDSPSQKPWYFMFTSSDDPIGHAFDPILRKWYALVLPCITTSNCIISSSSGLVCVMDIDTRRDLFICNPITRSSRKLPEPHELNKSDYTSLAISAASGYTVAVVKSKQVPGNFYQWEVSIHCYSSGTGEWSSPVAEVLSGWRGGAESVICGEILYFLIYTTGSRSPCNRLRLVAYKLFSEGVVTRECVGIPFTLTCGKLMNLNGKLVMVGGMGKVDRPDVIKGIGVWVLKENEWEEIARMPAKYFQGFGELDDVFASSGNGEIIYIQSYGAPALLVFDINHRLWKWSVKCPVTKRFPLQLFTGFCFQPSLQVMP